MTAPAPAPTPSGGRPRPDMPAVTLALGALTVVVAAGMGRLFAGDRYLVPVVATAAGAHAVAWLARRYAFAAPVTVGVSLGFVVAAVGWFVLPESTAYGLPTPSTLSDARHAMEGAAAAFREVIAPAPATDGFLIASIMGVAAAAFLADAAAFRVRATFEAVIPSFTLFVFTATLGVADGRAAAIGSYLAVLVLFVALHQEATENETLSWFASRARRGRAVLLRTAAVLGAVAVVTAVVAGPRFPGADSPALIRWQGADAEGRTTRTTVSPLVDIRGRLVDRSNIEVFTVVAGARAYWRLTSLDRFDGQIWSAEGTYENARRGLRSPTTAGDEVVVDQQYTIANLSSIWLPAAFQPREVAGLGGVSFNPDSSSLISDRDTTDGMTYAVRSTVPRLAPDVLAGATAGGLGDDAARRYRSLPELSARVVTLAQSIVAGTTSHYERARALQDFFHSGRFTYDLNVGPGHGDRALEQFLFDTRRGYCEQFAGAYAVLARAVGLPTRVAVGFTPGELGQDGAYHVRDLNAHAWPEVHMGQFGWVAFEPTPGRGAPGAEDYTGRPEAQASVTNPSVATTVPEGEPAPTEPEPSPGTTLVPEQDLEATAPPADTGGEEREPSPLRLALVALLAVAGLLVLWAVGVPVAARVRRDRRRARATTAAARVELSWVEAEEALALTGAARRPPETLSEYADRVGRARALRPEPATALATLAREASVVTYAGADVPDELAASAAREAEVVTRAVHDAAGLWQRRWWDLTAKRIVGPRVSRRGGSVRAGDPSGR